MDTLPACGSTSAPQRARKRYPWAIVCHHHEAPGEDARGALSDRGGREARLNAVSRGLGVSQKGRTISAWDARRSRPAFDFGEIVREGFTNRGVNRRV